MLSCRKRTAKPSESTPSSVDDKVHRAVTPSDTREAEPRSRHLRTLSPFGLEYRILDFGFVTHGASDGITAQRGTRWHRQALASSVRPQFTTAQPRLFVIIENRCNCRDLPCRLFRSEVEDTDAGAVVVVAATQSKSLPLRRESSLNRRSDNSSELREHLVKKTETVECKPRFAGFPRRNLLFKMDFELGECPLKLLLGAHHLTRLANAVD